MILKSIFEIEYPGDAFIKYCTNYPDKISEWWDDKIYDVDYDGKCYELITKNGGVLSINDVVDYLTEYCSDYVKIWWNSEILEWELLSDVLNNIEYLDLDVDFVKTMILDISSYTLNATDLDVVIYFKKGVYLKKEYFHIWWVPSFFDTLKDDYNTDAIEFVIARAPFDDWWYGSAIIDEIIIENYNLIMTLLKFHKDKMSQWCQSPFIIDYLARNVSYDLWWNEFKKHEDLVYGFLNFGDDIVEQFMYGNLNDIEEWWDPLFYASFYNVVKICHEYFDVWWDPKMCYIQMGRYNDVYDMFFHYCMDDVKKWNPKI